MNNSTAVPSCRGAVVSLLTDAVVEALWRGRGGGRMGVCRDGSTLIALPDALAFLPCGTGLPLDLALLGAGVPRSDLGGGTGLGSKNVLGFLIL